MQRKKVEQFLESCWKSQGVENDQFVCVSTKTKSGRGVWKDHALRWPLKRGWSEGILEDDRNCYFSPNIYSEGRRRAEYAIGKRLIWSDLDEVNPEEVWRKPTVAWQSSPNRYACIWRVKLSKATTQLSRDATYTIGADKGGWDITQVLRVPGTKNWKYKGGPSVVTMWEDWDRTWSASKLGIPRDVRQDLESGPLGKSDRSKVLWSIMCRLVESGYGGQEIENLVSTSLWNKFKSTRQLKADIQRALEKKAYKASPQKESSEGWNIVFLNKVKSEDTDWLWKPYIPLSAVTILEGDPESAKSWLTLKVAATLSTGGKMPGGRMHKGTSLIMNAEDSVTRTVKRRVEYMKADMSQIAVPDRLDHTNLEDLEEVLDTVRPKLVVLDPIQAYTGEADINKMNEVRSKMNWLGDLAEHYKCAVVCVRHLNKSGKGKSTYRGSGSIDFLAAARSVILVGTHPHKGEGTWKVMIQTKCNLVEKRGIVLGFSLAKNKFRWQGPQDVRVEDVLKYDPGDARREIGEAIVRLKQALKEGTIRTRKDALAVGESWSYTDDIIKEAWRWAKGR